MLKSMIATLALCLAFGIAADPVQAGKGCCGKDKDKKVSTEQKEGCEKKEECGDKPVKKEGDCCKKCDKDKAV